MRDNGLWAHGGLDFTYDAANQPTRAWGSQNDNRYTYDGNLKRVKSVANGKTTYWVYSAVTGNMVTQHTPSENKSWWYVGGAGVEVRHRGETGENHTRYLDHLGSVVASTNGLHATTHWREAYTPFGEKRNNPGHNRDDKGFTGHVQDDATGLTYMQARFYDPVMGRFLSPDPVTFLDKPYPGQFNRYAYTWNDPINATDPTGEFLHIAALGAISGVVGAVVDVGVQLAQNGGDIRKIDGGRALRAGLVSGATGAAAATCGACAVGVAGIASGADQTYSSIEAGDNIGTALAKGAVAGTVGAVTAGKAGRLADHLSADIAVSAMKGNVPVETAFATQAAASAGLGQIIGSEANELTGGGIDGAVGIAQSVGSTVVESAVQADNYLREKHGL